MAARNKISYIGQEPEFIRKFKEKVGYVPDDTVDTKRDAAAKFRENQEGDSDAEEKEDERPQVVVLKPGDLCQAEAEKMGVFNKDDKDEEPPADGKIMFKKPVKRSSDQPSDLHASTKKKKEADEPKKEKSTEKKTDSKKKKEVKKTNLLSFDEDEEDG